MKKINKLLALFFTICILLLICLIIQGVKVNHFLEKESAGIQEEYNNWRTCIQNAAAAYEREETGLAQECLGKAEVYQWGLLHHKGVLEEFGKDVNRCREFYDVSTYLGGYMKRMASEGFTEEKADIMRAIDEWIRNTEDVSNLVFQAFEERFPHYTE
ncbi:hypothetical protein [Cuneatibacter caecimuris]|uniref:DUF4363 family protein n=1 Tax=Cuneatibacter caecimuris TaxID=1796618 RepID=A0A4Q7PMN4_9FIRM|nr:hypothetical protein [Cuneatibacter caecimuris]RZT01160.1 hypothetical protein EV209_1602 [Cuneatibacter caecimuris]